LVLWGRLVQLVCPDLWGRLVQLVCPDLWDHSAPSAFLDLPDR
jgi:hypothetical protein